MRTRLFLLLFTATALAALPQSDSKDSRDSEKRTPEKQTTLTGCLDQRQDTYVLGDVSDMSRLTKLKGKSFSDDNFARYLGRKVTVSGTMTGDIFHVTKIEQIAKTCSP